MIQAFLSHQKKNPILGRGIGILRFNILHFTILILLAKVVTPQIQTIQYLYPQILIAMCIPHTMNVTKSHQMGTRKLVQIGQKEVDRIFLII
jgi:hypothetical protein